MIRSLINSPVAKNFVIYGTTNVFASGLPLLLLPFLTSYLKPQDMAMIAIFQLFYNFLNPFVGINGQALTSVVFYQKSSEQFHTHRSAIVWLILLSAPLILAIILPFQSILFEYTGLDLKWILVMLVFITFEKFNEFLLTFWRLQNKAYLFGAWRMLRVVLELGLSVGIVIAIETSWKGRVEGMALASVTIGFLSMLWIIKDNGWKLPVNKEDFLEIIRFGIPFVPHVLGGVIINYADLLFIRNMISESATGLYSVGYQVGMIIALVQNSFNQAWAPWFYARLKDITEDWKKKIVQITYVYFVALAVIAILLSTVSPYLFAWFIDERYILAQEFVSWIAAGFAINGMYKMQVNYLIFLKMSKWIGGVTILTAGINLILNYLLISQYGAIGAAQATAISFLIQFVVIWFLSARFYPMNWLMR